MKKYLILFALTGLGLAAPTYAQAQAILVVDTDRILAECTACRSATTTLQQQEQQLKQRAQTLESQLKPEETSLQTAVKALAGKQPDAALKQRITAFEGRARQAQTELSNREQQLQSTVMHVRQQVGSRAVQITEQVRARRQASIVLSKGSVIASNSAIDITGEVLAALNQQLPSVSVTPLPQQQQQARPQGR
jgi:outer membrane protein